LLSIEELARRLTLSHTIKVIAGGLVLLALCLLVGRSLAPGFGLGVANGIRIFLPLWLIASAVNMWIGVSRAGYSVREEAPIFLVVFGVPAALALLVFWKFSRGN
jgi:hypothetical protein